MKCERYQFASTRINKHTYNSNTSAHYNSSPLSFNTHKHLYVCCCCRSGKELIAIKNNSSNNFNALTKMLRKLIIVRLSRLNNKTSHKQRATIMWCCRCNACLMLAFTHSAAAAAAVPLSLCLTTRGTGSHSSP